jgi:glucan phosphoethanolaminetransferase (alkaline phosphatase superfamily)
MSNIFVPDRIGKITASKASVLLVNGKKHRFGDTSCSRFAQDANDCQFLNGIIDATSAGSYASALDSELIPAVRAALDRKDPRLLTVCDPMGSHSNDANRPPADFKHFPVTRAPCPVARQTPNLSTNDHINLRKCYDNYI